MLERKLSLDDANNSPIPNNTAVAETKNDRPIPSLLQTIWDDSDQEENPEKFQDAWDKEISSDSPSENGYAFQFDRPSTRQAAPIPHEKKHNVVVRYYQEDEPAEEKLTTEEQATRDSFACLVKTIFNLDCPNYLDLLEDPLYKPHKLVIYQGLQKIHFESEEHPVKIAAIFFARENALHIANAMQVFRYKNPNFPLDFSFASNTMQKIYLDMIALGQDAEIAAKSILQNLNRLDGNIQEYAYGYLQVLLKLKQEGVQLTSRACLAIIMAFKISDLPGIQALLNLHIKDLLTDHFYTYLAFYDNFQYLKDISVLLIHLNSTISLSEEMIENIIRQGAFAKEFFDKIKKIKQPSLTDINAILEQEHESKNDSSHEETFNNIHSPRLNKNNILLTRPLAMLISTAESQEDVEIIVDHIIDLKNNELLTDYLLSMFVLYDGYFDQEKIEFVITLLIMLKKDLNLPIPDTLINLIFEENNKLRTLTETTEHLIVKNIRISIHDLMILFQCEYKLTDHVIETYSQYPFLSTTASFNESEMNGHTLPVTIIKNILKYRNAPDICKLLSQYPNKVLLLNESLFVCTLTRSIKEIPALLELFLSSKFPLSLDKDTLDNIAIAILCGDGPERIQELLTQKAACELLGNKEILPLPKVLSQCVLSYFYTPPTIRKHIRIEELENKVVNCDASEQKFASNCP